MGEKVPKKDIGEPAIKRLLEDRLQTIDGVWLKEFQLPGSGKIDYITFRWLDDYEIDICGYECKGTITAKTAANVLNTQISDYRKVTPKTFLVATARQEEAVKQLCSMDGVGFWQVTGEGLSSDPLQPTKRALMLLDLDRCKELRCIGSMCLAFREVFSDILAGKEPRQGKYWVSTPESNEQTQYNAGYLDATRTVYGSVNLENCRRMMKKIDIEALSQRITSLPDEYWLKAWLIRQVIPRNNIYLPLIQKTAGEVSNKDIDYVKDRSGKQTIAIQIGTDLWGYDDLLSRHDHVGKMVQVRENLSSIHQALRGKA